MKKISILLGAALMAFAFQSCSVTDNPIALEEEGFNPANYDQLVYDFEAAGLAGENPANFNGNQNNGQGFNAYSVKIRNDYKGYTWAEGSVLPEVCHIYRRSDRINGNVVVGGLKFPNNREFAIDGLDAGSAVAIYYDAEAADEKELVWYVGEVNEEGAAVGPGEGTPVTAATIAGVDCVPNETTVASGALIEISKVTPAVNGTGYIVLQGKKNMVISKIVIYTPKQ
ncbi:MAG: hypothetical protein IJ637_09620 [Prevotella sp.]|nr:hypothetical protein [Prevotella sp.]